MTPPPPPLWHTFTTATPPSPACSRQRLPCPSLRLMNAGFRCLPACERTRNYRDPRLGDVKNRSPHNRIRRARHIYHDHARTSMRAYAYTYMYICLLACVQLLPPKAPRVSPPKRSNTPKLWTCRHSPAPRACFRLTKTHNRHPEHSIHFLSRALMEGGKTQHRALLFCYSQA